MRVVAIVQARLGSSRFPGKVLEDVGGEPAIVRLLRNLTTCRRVDEVVLAAPYTDLALWDVLPGAVTGFSGDEHDVLDRYARAAEAAEADVIVRITGDCPLLDPVLVDAAVAAYKGEDYYWRQGYPRGVGDIELLSRAILERADSEATRAEDREHVVLWPLRFGKWMMDMAPLALYRPRYRLCLDEPRDLAAIRATLEAMGNPAVARVKDIVRVLDGRPDIVAMNAEVRQVS